MRPPRAPEGLDTGGATLWRAVTGVYELSPAELETLRQCCRQVDLIARLDDALRDAPVVVTGSMGQMKAHPLVGAVAEARRTLDGLQRSLNLPMPDEERDTAGRQRRWRRRRHGGGGSAVARWRNRRPGAGIPAWVLDAWVYGGDPNGLADAWLDDLYDRDRAAWEVAFVTLISTPAYTRPR